MCAKYSVQYVSDLITINYHITKQQKCAVNVWSDFNNQYVVSLCVLQAPRLYGNEIRWYRHDGSSKNFFAIIRYSLTSKIRTCEKRNSLRFYSVEYIYTDVKMVYNETGSELGLPRLSHHNTRRCTIPMEVSRHLSGGWRVTDTQRFMAGEDGRRRRSFSGESCA